ncbi:MAG: hypothetical protein HQM10_04935 [Candidatus Riflebacteria bacterium]|nr:hypothetical protein [Candidatus Riflebacteria bacterium]
MEAKLGNEEFLGEAGDVEKKSECLQNIQLTKEDLNKLRTKRKEKERMIMLSELPDDKRPTQLLPLNKQLSDTIKMIAYRAETALVSILRRYLNNEDEARGLIRELLVSPANLMPNDNEQTLTVEIHRMTSPSHDKAIGSLLEELTIRDFHHPETNAKMIFKLM